MRWRVSAIIIVISSSLAGLATVVTNYDPHTAGEMIRFLFVSSLILLIIGLTLGVVTIFKKWKGSI